MIENKYICRVCGVRHCTLKTKGETPHACPYLIVVPEWKFAGQKVIK